MGGFQYGLGAEITPTYGGQEICNAVLVMRVQDRLEKVFRVAFVGTCKGAFENMLAQRAVLLAHRFPCCPADRGTRFSSYGNRFPGRWRCLRLRPDDFNLIAIVERGDQRHDLALILQPTHVLPISVCTA